MVTIVDPHIKRDGGYKIHKEATAKGLYIKDKDGKARVFVVSNVLSVYSTVIFRCVTYFPNESIHV